MNIKITIALSIIMIVLSVILIGLSFFISNIIVMIIGIIILLVSIFFLFINTTIDMYRQDKILNIEALKKQGLTIVSCKNCLKDNVLEDQYCIYCGEKLNNNGQE